MNSTSYVVSVATRLIALTSCVFGLGCGDSTSATDAGTTGDAAPDSSNDAMSDAPLADVPTDAPILSDEEITMGEGDPLPGFSSCTITTARHITGLAGHEPACSELDYPISTPASGNHYSVWADFKQYEQPVRAGFLVHAMEHGAIVFQHGCAIDDCPTLHAAIADVVAAHGTDPACEAQGIDARFIVAPNPDLPEAAVVIGAWEHLYFATCVDVPSMSAFVEAHYGQGPEDLCARGRDGESRDWCD